MKLASIIVFASCIPFFLFAQDLEKIGKKDVLKVNGGLNYSSVFYDAKGIQGRRQPFTYFINGNITGNIAGITLPYTFNYSNNQLTYTQPYNINSFNPSYKWAKAYIGTTSMNFSQYTMAGHIFNGAGIELTPKNIRFATLYGRFKKAVEFDHENNTDATMSFKRMGYGASLGYEAGGHSIKAIYFTAKDDIHSLSFLPINTAITPMENTVISLTGKTMLYKNFTLEGEYALSALTRNITSPSDLNAYPNNKLPLLFQPNATSQFFSAYKGSIGYRIKMAGIQLNYERVEPDYMTLGAYYFNNDLENITLAPSLTLLEGKMNLSINTGVQRNNLKNDKLNTTRRWVGAANLSYAPNAKWNFSAGYSNFTSFTKQKPQEDPYYRNTLDTLNFYQIAQSANANILYNFGSNKIKQNIVLSGNYMVSSQTQGSFASIGILGPEMNKGVPSQVINVNAAHNAQFTESKTSVGILFNMNQVKMQSTEMIYWGPGLNISQSLYKNKIKLSGGSTFNSTLNNGTKSNSILNHRITFTYSPQFANEKTGKLSFNLSAIYLQKIASPGNIAFNEFTGNIGLNYSF